MKYIYKVQYVQYNNAWTKFSPIYFLKNKHKWYCAIKFIIYNYRSIFLDLIYIHCAIFLSLKLQKFFLEEIFLSNTL